MSDAPDASLAATLAAIQTLLRGHTSRRDEARLLAILAGLDAPSLDRALAALDLGHLVRAVDDHWTGPDHRAALFQVLTRERLADLSVPTRAALVLALQTGRTSRPHERAIREVFLGTRGRDLTALKNALDALGGRRNLRALVYRDLDDLATRAAILAHIATEATAAPAGELKVLSDVDDTFYANWKDRRYPPRTVYPGVLAFYTELDRGPDAVPGRPGDLVFVTARPGDGVGLVARYTLDALQSRGVGPATVLLGSLLHVTSSERIAAGKYLAFKQFRALYPEYRFAFVGDSGQGDATFARALVDLDGDVVAGTFIHAVTATPADDRRAWRAAGVRFFDTYVGAALEALALGLVQPAGVARVAAAAEEGFAALSFASDALRRARREELDRDLAAARETLSLHVAPPAGME